MTEEKTLAVRIPFSGFYNSFHDQELDSALSRIIEDDDGEVDTENAIYAKVNDSISWKAVHVSFAKLYAEKLADECKAVWQFKELISPREYNFRTDEIDVMIEYAELIRMYQETDKGTLAALVKERLEPRDGFIPFYSNDLKDWGKPSDYDEVQWSLVLESYCDEYCEKDERDLYLVDDSNGEITDIIYSGLPTATVVEINEYRESLNQD